MIGNNELKLNEITVIEAMQEWLDKRMAGYSPKIVGITHDSMKAQFTIKTADKDGEA